MSRLSMVCVTFVKKVNPLIWCRNDLNQGVRTVTEATWEKPTQTEKLNVSGNVFARYKFLIGGVLMLGAVVYLIFSGTMSGARYFITIEELATDTAYIGQTVRVSGAVIGETIEYDTEHLILDFTVAHIPEETDNLALTLHEAVMDPNAARVPVHMEGEVMPDLLSNEAQAILTGEMGEDGVFYASELLLKCPSRYEEVAPEQAS